YYLHEDWQDDWGGELRLQSTPGQGSTFSVRLYLSEVHNPPRALAGQLQARPFIGGYLGPRRTLLVVDDQPIHRQLLAGVLIPLGFTVREAASGQECLEIIRDAPPDALLLDLSMDDLSGWQTAALVRQQYSAAHLPIVIVSADLFENQPEQLERAGCQAFVGKPVLESELMDTLAWLLALEWVETPAESPATGLQGPSAASQLQPPQPLQLPPELQSDITRLARFGDGAGLRKLLAAAQTTYPEWRSTLQALDAAAQRFDFPLILESLGPAGPTDS
ncbi:MAG: response regulator, partial [Comamonas sp.]